MLIEVTAAPGSEARSTRRSEFQVLYHSHVQVVLRQTRHNLCFHQFFVIFGFSNSIICYTPS